MTDGERIMNWLKEYNTCQKLRDEYMDLMSLLGFCSNVPNPEGCDFIKAQITKYEHRMRVLREKIMIYGDY